MLSLKLTHFIATECGGGQPGSPGRPLHWRPHHQRERRVRPRPGPHRDDRTASEGTARSCVALELCFLSCFCVERSVKILSFSRNVQSGNKVTLQTIALENTSIKVGPARKTKHKGKMARRSKKSKRRDNYDRWASDWVLGFFFSLSVFAALLCYSSSVYSGRLFLLQV